MNTTNEPRLSLHDLTNLIRRQTGEPPLPEITDVWYWPMGPVEAEAEAVSESRLRFGRVWYLCVTVLLPAALFFRPASRPHTIEDLLWFLAIYMFIIRPIALTLRLRDIGYPATASFVGYLLGFIPVLNLVLVPYFDWRAWSEPRGFAIHERRDLAQSILGIAFWLNLVAGLIFLIWQLNTK